MVNQKRAGEQNLVDGMQGVVERIKRIYPEIKIQTIRKPKERLQMNETVKKLADKIELVNGSVSIAAEGFEAFTVELQWMCDKIEEYQIRDKKEGRDTLLGLYSRENGIKMRNLSNLAQYLNQRLKKASEELDQVTHEANEEAWNDQK